MEVFGWDLEKLSLGLEGRLRRLGEADYGVLAATTRGVVKGRLADALAVTMYAIKRFLDKWLAHSFSLCFFLAGSCAARYRGERVRIKES